MVNVFIVIVLIGPTLLDLMEELNEVVEWFTFGVFLKIPYHKLKAIECDYWTVRERQRDMFAWWLNSTPKEEIKWSTIVHTLSRIHYLALAQKIALKYGKCTSTYTCSNCLSVSLVSQL